VIETRPPPTMGSRAPRIYYVTQAAVAPPTFIAMTNAPDNIHFSYQRYVINQLRKQFGFEGCPVRVHYKPRRRRGEGEPEKSAAEKESPAAKIRMSKVGANAKRARVKKASEE
jgi:hypothetical protein